MYNRRLFFIVILGFVMTIYGFSGCSSKKKITAVPKQTVKTQEKAPAPTPKAVEQPKIEKKAEEIPSIPRDLKFATIYFDYDKSNIRDDQRSIMINNAQLLSKYKTVRILIEGHCDERGSVEYNLALGQRRADSIKTFFIDYGIDRSRISTVSYGKLRPLDKGNNETAWARNRRGESIITSGMVSKAE